jgi:hypothetical protein
MSNYVKKLYSKKNKITTKKRKAFEVIILLESRMTKEDKIIFICH